MTRASRAIRVATRFLPASRTTIGSSCHRFGQHLLYKAEPLHQQFKAVMSASLRARKRAPLRGPSLVRASTAASKELNFLCAQSKPIFVRAVLFSSEQLLLFLLILQSHFSSCTRNLISIATLLWKHFFPEECKENTFKAEKSGSLRLWISSGLTTRKKWLFPDGSIQNAKRLLFSSR